MAGGTGSGLSSLILERLSIDFGKQAKLALPIFPSDESEVETYNSVLSTYTLLEHTDVNMVLENEAI